MSIPPDTKDWTWVLERTCPECGFPAADATPGTVASAIPQMLPRWQAVLKRSDADVRPDPFTWSPLEYACHVRDVFGVFESRLQLMLTRDNPTFADWDQDQAAVDGEYDVQDPRIVDRELVQAGRDVADAFAVVPEQDWQREGLRSNGSAFTVLTLSQYFLHDVVHHLHDVDA